MAIIETNINITPSNVTVKTIDADGIQKVKNSNIPALREVFGSIGGIETPFLPSQWGVVKYYKVDNFEGYILTTPPGEREVTFDISGVIEEDTKYIVPVPALLWIFQIRKGESRSVIDYSMVYAIKHELISMDQELYRAPFPNIGIGEGICWGQTIDVPTPKSVQQLPSRFFETPFNFDLSSSVIDNHELHENARSFIEYIDSPSRNAVAHMVSLSEYLKEAKENDEEFEYPFGNLQEDMSLSQAISRYLPEVSGQNN